MRRTRWPSALIGRRITVITNSLPVMDAVARGGEATRLIGLCGRLDPDRGAFTGAPVLAAARGHFADRLLLGADALAADGRLLDDDAAGAAVKRALVAQSDQVAPAGRGTACRIGDGGRARRARRRPRVRSRRRAGPAAAASTRACRYARS